MNDDGQPTNGTEQFVLSVGEQRLVDKMREMQSAAGRRPMIATVYIVDGIWQIWEGIPRGTVKDIDN